MFGYDPVGNMISHQLSDNVSHVNTYQFDVMNRRTHISYFDSTPSVDFDYTATGKRWHVKLNNTLYATYSYDNRDRLTLIQHADGQAVGYNYDQNSNRIELDVTSGGATNKTFYGYDPDNRLNSVINNSLLGTGLPITYDYYLNDLRQDLKYPNGITTTYGYNALNRLNHIAQIKSNVINQSYDYTLDNAGNRTQVQENDGTTLTNIYWCYDAAMRLIGEGRNMDCTPTLPTLTPTNTPTPNVTKTNYKYDSVGNRLSKTTDGQQTIYTYNSLDQLISDSTGLTYAYDGRGNQISAIGSVATMYHWNAADRLTDIIKTGMTSLNYTYDGDGRRIQVANVTTTAYLWDEISRNGDVVSEVNPSLPTTNYLRNENGDMLGAYDNLFSYYLRDGQGNVRTLININGSSHANYDAFGNIYSSSMPSSVSYLYDAQKFDKSSSLYSLRARYYDVNNGRFLTRDRLHDPIKYKELNRYVYSTNDPINTSDPSGNQNIVEYTQTQQNTSSEVAPVAELGDEAAGFAANSDAVTTNTAAISETAPDAAQELQQLEREAPEDIPQPANWATIISWRGLDANKKNLGPEIKGAFRFDDITNGGRWMFGISTFEMPDFFLATGDRKKYGIPFVILTVADRPYGAPGVVVNYPIGKIFARYSPTNGYEHWDIIFTEAPLNPKAAGKWLEARVTQGPYLQPIRVRQ